jgi:hypothetical protein
MGFLSSIFGPSKDEIWGQIATDIGGSYEDGGFWGRDVLRYRSGEWEITLDTYTVSTGKSSTTYTRMRAPFINKDGLYFKIYREGIFSAIGKLFKMQDITVGDPFFDEQFVVKGNNEEKLKQLLSDPKLKELIEHQPNICFEVKGDEGFFGGTFPEGVDELNFTCYGVLRDVDLLKNLFAMFTATLERLVQIDSAYANDPNVRL